MKRFILTLCMLCTATSVFASGAASMPLTPEEQQRLQEGLKVMEERGAIPPQLTKVLLTEAAAGAETLPDGAVKATPPQVIRITPPTPSAGGPLPPPGTQVPIEYFDGFIRPRPVPGQKPLPENPTAEDVYKAMDNLQARLDGFARNVTDFEQYMVAMDARQAQTELLQQKTIAVIADIRKEIGEWETKFLELQGELNLALADANTSKETIVKIQGELGAAQRRIGGLQGQVAALHDLARPGGILRALGRKMLGRG